MTTYPPDLREYADVGLPLPTNTTFGWYDLLLVSGTSRATLANMLWDSGDLLVAMGMIADGAKTMTGLATASGLTFAALADVIGTPATNATVRTWQATAGSAGQSQVSSPNVSATGTAAGVGCCRFARSTGLGTPVTGQAHARQLSLTRTSANSGVLFVAADWGAESLATTDPLLLAGVNGGYHLLNSSDGANYGVHILWYPNEVSTGTTSYGFSGTAAQDWAKVAVEVFGTNTAPPSPPTPGAGTDNTSALAAMKFDKAGIW